MGDYYYTIEKPKHGSQDWLNVRWKDEDGLARISASVAAAVHGTHPYTSRADLCVELLAKTPPTPKPTNSAMDRGNRFEPVLLSWYADMEQIEVRTPDLMYAFATEDNAVRLIATLDGITPDGIPVEVKTSKKIWNGQLPDMWYWQGVQQAICTNTNKIEWVIFDSNLEFHRHTQVVTSDEKQKHIQACRDFLSAIDNDDMPEDILIDYHHAEQLNPKSEAKQVELPEGAGILFEQWATVKEHITTLEEHESKLKAQIGMFLGDAEEGTIDGNVVVTWKSQSRESFDTKRFESEHPALADKFRKTTSFRVMKAKGRK